MTSPDAPRSRRSAGPTRRTVLATASGAAVAAAVGPVVNPGRAAAHGSGRQPSWVGTWASVPTSVPRPG